MEVCPKLETVSFLPNNANDQIFPADLRTALSEARSYIQFYNWVEEIDAQYLGVGVDGVVYLFLFKIKPTRQGVDPWLWVVVGDVPPAYITCDDAITPYDALDSYIGAMEEWVSAAKSGASVADLIPVNVPANLENASRLERRLKFLDERILPSLKG